MTKERPIIMSSDSVRAIIANTKTQTRRICKPAHCEHDGSAGAVHRDGSGKGWVAWWPDAMTAEQTKELYPGNEGFRCPYGTIGDVLYCKEKWRISSWWLEEPELQIGYADGKTKLWIMTDEEFEKYHERFVVDCTDDCIKAGLETGSDGCFISPGGDYPTRWRSSVYMPKACARAWLRITDIRVERLQDISVEDAIAEGIMIPVDENGKMLIQITGNYLPVDYTEKKYTESSDSEIIRAHFAATWDSLNAKRGYPWADNCWIWALTFERIDHD
jgi:hypothetical protein